MRYLGKRDKVVSIVGDGAMTGGMAFEAMNDAVQQNADLIVVLNDNDMSISQATGGFSKHLATLWQRGLAVDIDKTVMRFLPSASSPVKTAVFVIICTWQTKL